MPRGGKREGAGRKPGSVTKKTREIAERAIEAGPAPLDVMLANMRHYLAEGAKAEAELAGVIDAIPLDDPDEARRLILAEVKKVVGLRQLAGEAAKDAAPFVHPRLAAVQVTDATLADMSDNELVEYLATIRRLQAETGRAADRRGAGKKGRDKGS